MNYESAVRRLANHANWPVDDTFSTANSLVFNLWQSTRSGNLMSSDILRDDVLACLEVINSAINQTSSPDDRASERVIDKKIILIASTIIDCCHEHSLYWGKLAPQWETERQWLRRATWMISHAWCGILHGDIDSLVEYIEIESLTKAL